MKDFIVLVLCVIVFVSMLAFIQKAENRAENIPYDFSQDATLVDLERKFRMNPKEGMFCSNSKCKSPVLDERNEYLEKNCLILLGRWSYSEKHNSLSVTTSRSYYKKANCGN